MNFNIIIPARKNSKGLPGKNRILLDYTMRQIPQSYYSNVIVSTDDEEISVNVANNYGPCRVHSRSDVSAVDTASTMDCISEVVEQYKIQGDVLMLYLTYPERKWSDIVGAYKLYKDTNSKSLLCREELEVSPYLCMHEVEGDKGRQITPHNLYRRQDYPKCFKLCHMVSIFNTNELQNLNKNLYNENTVFYKISKAIDVDTEHDLSKMREKNDSQNYS
jgi:CMP-N-acetylneuraminic acid synthetase